MIPEYFPFGSDGRLPLLLDPVTTAKCRLIGARKTGGRDRARAAHQVLWICGRRGVRLGLPAPAVHVRTAGAPYCRLLLLRGIGHLRAVYFVVVDDLHGLAVGRHFGNCHIGDFSLARIGLLDRVRVDQLQSRHCLPRIPSGEHRCAVEFGVEALAGR